MMKKCDPYRRPHIMDYEFVAAVSIHTQVLTVLYMYSYISGLRVEIFTVQRVFTL